ncbi:hypothetical protein [Oceanicaulis sp.]|uniref:hypothetical protein n=1 Tax=Oceanicaulis sp. TaxID=1924941 RepID=UPI003BAA7ED9
MKLLKDATKPMKKPGAEAPGFNGFNPRLVYQIETRLLFGKRIVGPFREDQACEQPDSVARGL